MAPGALAILAPFLGRKSKKYEKLQTEDPEKKRQEATEEEINRLNTKIGKLVTSMSREELDLASGPDDACLVCCRSRASMQVSPCNHQSLCRLCFVHSIQDAVTSRALPLSCMVCNAKIFRVKNNPQKRNPNSWRQPGGYPNDPSIGGPPAGVPRYYNNQMKMPKSVSGYSLCASNEEEFQRSSNNNGMPTSASSYSMTSGLSSMSSSSFESNRSVRSSTSARSNASQKSVQSNSSWFSIGSLSSFQAGGIIDSKTINKPPRAHSLSSRGKQRVNNNSINNNNNSANKMSPSPSNFSVRSWSGPPTTNRPASTTGVSCANQIRGDNRSGGFYRDPRLNKSESTALDRRAAEFDAAFVDSSTQNVVAPLSPNSIDERIRAVQFGMRSATLVEDPASQAENNNAATANNNSNSSGNNLRRLQQGRESFRHLHQKPSGTSSVKAENLNIDNCYLLKGQMRRLSGSGRYAKSPDLNETTFSMSTIEEEQEVALSLKNLSA